MNRILFRPGPYAVRDGSPDKLLKTLLFERLGELDHVGRVPRLRDPLPRRNLTGRSSSGSRAVTALSEKTTTLRTPDEARRTSTKKRWSQPFHTYQKLQIIRSRFWYLFLPLFQTAPRGPVFRYRFRLFFERGLLRGVENGSGASERGAVRAVSGSLPQPVFWILACYSTPQIV